ncbi:MAG: hydantoinase/oxoprolinase family protein [Desulfobacterales bacterium]|nr:hydantoinase/oxoprolinase family protein [Desulfobacterales bacterium]
MSDTLGHYFDHVFQGHRISGNLNFPRRIATTFLNTSVYLIHKEFFAAVKHSLEQKGLNVPIHILKADGGTMNFDASVDVPGQSILSGPAASVMGAILSAPPNEDVLVMDIGGTTTDMAVLINKVPVLEPLGIEIGSYKTLIRALHTHSIGIGGDSLVKISNQQIQIGPERIGPAMAFGGPKPTPTDAIAVLGLLKGGNTDKSYAGIQMIADVMGTDIKTTAQLIFKKTCEIILQEANAMVQRLNMKPVYTVHELLEGYTISPKSIVILGTPAAHFAPMLQELSHYKVNAVPHHHVANAIGAALARPTSEINLFADTSKGIFTIPEENYYESIPQNFSKFDMQKKAQEILKTKAINSGANMDDFQIEILEDLQFNMVRGFRTIGKNMRMKAQIKPGLLKGYERLINSR